MLYLNGKPEYSSINNALLILHHQNKPAYLTRQKATVTVMLSINPFELKLHNAQFYRLKGKEYQERICIYFIIDNALPLLLYVGETMQTTKQRWNGTHDCKDYVMNYVETHRKHGLEVKMCSAFWHDTPENRTGRLRLESALIKRWQSPFNKENWGKYGKPFGKI